jgi:hypothetical protein
MGQDNDKLALRTFRYQYLDGPLEGIDELKSSWDTGNCRRAVQLYAYVTKGIFLQPQEVLNPNAYRAVGTFLYNNAETFSIDKLEDGDIVYAEAILSKRGQAISRGRSEFSFEDDYLVALHTALYTGIKNREIWHATTVSGISCYWSMEKFTRYYRPVAAKRVSRNDA